MTPLYFTIEPSFECANGDSSDAAFVHDVSLIGGQDAIEEYLAYRMFPLLANFGFAEIMDGETPVSKVVVPLPEFPLARFEGESNDCFLARVELDAENMVGSYGRAEHDACIQTLPNVGYLNRVFEKAGVAYGPRPQPGTEASTEVAKKRKVVACVKSSGKWTKVVGKKRMAVASKAAAVKGVAAPVLKDGVAARAGETLKASATSMVGAATSKAAVVRQNWGPLIKRRLLYN
jgi:hypothetical protein